MSNRFKIKMESKRYPATFAAFDCPYYDGQDLMGKPLSERKRYLNKAVRETGRLAVSRTFPYNQAGALFALAPGSRGWRGSWQSGWTACTSRGSGRGTG